MSAFIALPCSANAHVLAWPASQAQVAGRDVEQPKHSLMTLRHITVRDTFVPSADPGSPGGIAAGWGPAFNTLLPTAAALVPLLDQAVAAAGSDAVRQTLVALLDSGRTSGSAAQ